MSPRINFKILFYLDLSLPCLEQLHFCVCFKVYYLNILKLASLFQMFFHLVNTEAWKLQCFLLESNIFISKCFIISYINVKYPGNICQMQELFNKYFENLAKF